MRREVVCALAAVALAVPAVAFADSPTDTTATTTEPVSTVTTLPSPTTPVVTSPAPDAVPVHSAPAHRASRSARLTAPVHRSSSTPVPQPRPRPVVPAQPVKKQVVVVHHHRARVTHSSPRAHGVPARHTHPATKAQSKPASVPAPAASTPSSGGSWVATAVIGGLIALLAALLLVAGIRAMRRTGDRAAGLSATPTRPRPTAVVAAPAIPIENEPELEPETVVVPVPESCRIEWWRGYVRSRFYAYESNGNGEPKFVAESPLFAWRSSKPPPESPDVLAAYARLVETLERLGWEPDGYGETWFSARFRRPVPEAPPVTV